MGQPRWTVEIYEKSNNNRRPLDDFLNDLPRRDRVLIENAMERLAKFGNKLDRPHVAYLRDGIYELRPKHYRLFYFFFDGEKIVITHGYAKKTNAVDPNQIDKAIEYRTDYLLRKP